MTAEYFEKKTNDSQIRTLVRTCHNYKNVALMKETFDENTGLWRSDNSFIITKSRKTVEHINLCVVYTTVCELCFPLLLFAVIFPSTSGSNKEQAATKHNCR